MPVSHFVLHFVAHLSSDLRQKVEDKVGDKVTVTTAERGGCWGVGPSVDCQSDVFGYSR